MKNRGTIYVNVPELPKKPKLQRRAERLIAKAEKQGYEFNDIQLSVFSAIVRANWDEDKINWLVLEQFDRMYYQFFLK